MPLCIFALEYVDSICAPNLGRLLNCYWEDSAVAGSAGLSEWMTERLWLSPKRLKDYALMPTTVTMYQLQCAYSLEVLLRDSTMLLSSCYKTCNLLSNFFGKITCLEYPLVTESRVLSELLTALSASYQWQTWELSKVKQWHKTSDP